MEQNPILLWCKVLKNIPNYSHLKSHVSFVVLWEPHKSRWPAGVLFLFQSAWPFEMILFLYCMQLKYTWDSPQQHFSGSIAFPTRNRIWMVLINEKRVENKFILIGNKHTGIQDHVGDLWAGNISLVPALQKWSVNTKEYSRQQPTKFMPSSQGLLQTSISSQWYFSLVHISMRKNKGRIDSLLHNLCSCGT